MASAAPVIWTVGHSNHELDRFVDLLRSQDIEFVVDVRSFPFSRFAPHFNRDALEPSLRDVGIRYLFLGEALGGRPSSDDQYDDEGHALYSEMSKEPAFQESIDRLLTGAQNHRIALVCSEANPADCHRRLLVGKVLTERGAVLAHILPNGQVRTENDVRLSEFSDQDALFGEDSAPWRSTQSVSHRARLSTSSPG